MYAILSKLERIEKLCEQQPVYKGIHESNYRAVTMLNNRRVTRSMTQDEAYAQKLMDDVYQEARSSAIDEQNERGTFDSIQISRTIVATIMLVLIGLIVHASFFYNFIASSTELEQHRGDAAQRVQEFANQCVNGAVQIIEEQGLLAIVGEEVSFIPTALQGTLGAVASRALYMNMTGTAIDSLQASIGEASNDQVLQCATFIRAYARKETRLAQNVLAEGMQRVAGWFDSSFAVRQPTTKYLDKARAKMKEMENKHALEQYINSTVENMLGNKNQKVQKMLGYKT